MLLALDGLIPELGAEDRLHWKPLSLAEWQVGEFVFLGLQDAQPVFAPVPPTGDIAPAYSQPSIWEIIARLAPELDQLHAEMSAALGL